jgi:hypothetical protein
MLKALRGWMRLKANDGEELNSVVSVFGKLVVITVHGFEMLAVLQTSIESMIR